MSNLKERILGNTTDNLHNTSKDILDVFTSTVDKLTALNKDVEARELEQFEIKKKIEAELEKLASLKTKHLAVIQKINKIFE